MQTFYNSWWFLLVIATVLDTEHCFGMAQPPMCGKYDTSLPRPVAVTVSSLTTRSVTITVTLSTGYYDALYVYVHSGQGVVSSGSANLGDQRFNTQTSQTYTVTLSSVLTLGMTYTINALIRSGTACSYPATNPTSATARQAQVPSAPTITGVREVSGGIQVAWTFGAGQLDKIIVTAQPTAGAAVTHNVTVFNNQPQNATIPASKLVKGQTYIVSLKAGYQSVQSTSSSAQRVTLTPAIPKAVRIENISVTSVTMNVTFRVGGYSSIEVELISMEVDPMIRSIGYGSIWLVNENDTQMVHLTNLPQQLTRGELYRVTVRTVSGTKKSDPSPQSSGKRIAPSPPIYLSVNPSSGDQSITVTWRSGGGIVSRFFVRIDDIDGWFLEDEVPYQVITGQYRHVFNPPKPGVYDIKVKSQSGQLNSSYVEKQGVSLSPPPVNASVLSTSSRSVLLTWQRDNNVNSYRLLVFQDQRCVQDVYFATQVRFPTSSCARVKTEALDVNGVDVTYNITGLLPYRGYQIALYVTFVAGSEPSRLNVMTDAEVPSEVPVTQVTMGGEKNVSVCWSRPEPFPGPTYYTLTLVDLGPDPRPDRQLLIQDMNNFCGEFTDLEEHWPYRIRLRASTKAGDGPTSESQEFRTPEAVPGQVTSLQFIAPKDSLSNVDVTWEPPKPRDRNANITEFILKYREKVSDNVKSFNIPWSRSDNEVYSKEVQVEPGETYNFSLVAVSKSFVGEVLYAEYLAPRGPPLVPTACVICPEISSQDSGPRSAHTFQVNLRADFFTDDTNGHIVDYGLIVTQTSSVKAESISQRLAATFYKNYANWREAKNKDFRTPYRATPIGWSFHREVMDRSKQETESFQYTVGKDENCAEAVDTFCNGPLKPVTKYSVKAFSCTHGGCAETDYINGYGTVHDVLHAEPNGSSGSSLTAVVSGVFSGVVVLILVVIIIFYCLRTRRKLSRDRKQTEESSSNTLPMSPYESIQTTVNRSEESHYEDLGRMVIPESRILTSNIKLSNGKHEIVKGTLELENGNLRSVAVRIIKGNHAFVRCQEEVAIMRSIGVHPNIVSFLGYSLKEDNSVLMLNGFEDYGDLQTFLREKRRVGANSGLTETNLLKFTEDVARGMAHLAKLNILHGDLRASNILVVKDLTAKISGLQQSRQAGEINKDLTKRNFPLQGWASIETLEKKIYTVHSEVWSFGVLMWEIMTYGATPYDGMKHAEIKNLLRKDCRLTCPKSCQIPLYTVMLECWNDDPEERPSFENLSYRLANIMTNVQDYMKIGIYETVDDIQRESDY